VFLRWQGEGNGAVEEFLNTTWLDGKQVLVITAQAAKRNTSSRHLQLHTLPKKIHS
jgi:hypothetical protein